MVLFFPPFICELYHDALNSRFIYDWRICRNDAWMIQAPSRYKEKGVTDQSMTVMM